MQRRPVQRNSLGRVVLGLLVFGAVVVWRYWNPPQNEQSPPAASAESERESAQQVPFDANREHLAEGLCRVVRVVDGDTLIISQGSIPKARLRLLGIDTPETVKENTVIQQWGPEATAFAGDMIQRGTAARLQLDKRRKDQYDRYLGYLFIDDLCLNEELVRAGLARVKSYPGDSESMALRFRKAESEAKKAARGIWSGK